jgi:hypothetical protein
MENWSGSQINFRKVMHHKVLIVAQKLILKKETELTCKTFQPNNT